MLVSIKNILENAYKKEYAVPAYNINSIEWAKFILEACNEDKSPVILEVTPSSIEYIGGYETVYNAVKSLIKELNIKVDVALHLDHAKDFETCKKAIDAGFRSVMIDASNKVLDENIDIVSKVVEYAHNNNTCVEAELGSRDGEKCSYEEVEKFVEETGIDTFAPAVGNKHGIYTTDADIDFELLGSISKLVKLPIVLHGASGLDENKITTAIFCGVAKININTDLQYAWAEGVRKYLEYDKDVYDPRKIIGSGSSEIKRVIHQKNILLKSINKSN